MAAADPRLILFPGLGADARLFLRQQSHFGQRLVTPAAPRPRERDDLAGYAARWASLLDQQGLFAAPFVLGGMSFGGQLALEMARVAPAKPAAIVLIASHRTSDSILPRFRQQQARGRRLPHALIRFGLRHLAGLFALREGLDEEARQILLRMAAETDIGALLWGAQAAAAWHFTEADARALGAPIFQIHGAADWVIPPHPGHPDRLLAGAKHLITFTHAREVNQYLEDALAAVSAAPPAPADAAQTSR
jgi:pimeloyl-ACP methyl ester carboxylesterase